MRTIAESGYGGGMAMCECGCDYFTVASMHTGSGAEISHTRQLQCTHCAAQHRLVAGRWERLEASTEGEWKPVPA